MSSYYATRPLNEQSIQTFFFFRSFLNAVSTSTLGPCVQEIVGEDHGTEVAVGLGVEIDELILARSLQQYSIVGRYRRNEMNRLNCKTVGSIMKSGPTRPDVSLEKDAVKGTLSHLRSNGTTTVEGVARRRLSSPSTRCGAQGTPLQLYLQGPSRRAETYFAFVSVSIFAHRFSVRFFAVSVPSSLALDLHLWGSLSKKP